MNRSSPSLGTLVGMAELHDLSFAHQVPPLVRLLAQEPELAADLLRARPWLAVPDPPDAQQVLETLLDQEWAGFVARLGRVGPWVFAATVADLQQLSGGYGRLVEWAVGHDLSDLPASTLLGRLRAEGVGVGAEPAVGAGVAEQTFWTLAEQRAAEQRSRWAARRAARTNRSSSPP